MRSLLSIVWLLAVAHSQPAAGASLATDKSEYVVGEHIVVSFAGSVGSDSDWIGLYPADQVANEGSSAWLYTTGSQEPGAQGPRGSVLFLPINLPAGEWEARLFRDEGYDLTARVAFDVVDPGNEPAPAPSGDLTVMSFNVWLSGRAVADGLPKIAGAIVACGPNVVAFQEADEMFGDDIAAELAAADPAWVDAEWVGDGDNVILSQYPIVDALPLVRGGVALSAALDIDGDTVWVVGSHLGYWRYGPYRARRGIAVHEIVRSERSGRGAQVDAIVSELDGLGSALVLGDHNAPSHLDWTEENAEQNFGLVVRWPTSLAMEDAGFVDAYRAVHPDPVADRAFTWTAGYPKGSFDSDDVHDRIDFVYGRNGDVTFTPVAAYTYDVDPWPSDHRAVVVSYELGR